MSPYARWTLRAGLPLFLLLAAWTFRAELTSWFAPGRAARAAAAARTTDAAAGAEVPEAASASAGDPTTRPVADVAPPPAGPPAPQPTATGSGAPAGQPTSQPTRQPAAPGPGFITLTPWQRQLIGVTTAPVERRSLQTSLRTVGRVTYDETRLADVNLKTRGWIEEVYVDYTGRSVERGQALFTVYSPELVSTQEELLLTARTLRTMEQRPGGGAVAREALGRQRSLLAAARRRLQLWDVTAGRLQTLLDEGRPRRAITVHAPASGVVVDRVAVAGMYATPGTRLYRIAALDTVWVLADVYEYELPRVRVGQPAVVELPYVAGRVYEGRVEFIYPYLDADTRTARVRLRVPNPDRALRPDMYADVSLEVDAGTHLAVPEEAVLRSGRRQVVFVDLGRGRLQPRQVQLGLRMSSHYEVLAGLAEGEAVVTSAQFLLDSESKLKSVMAAMSTRYE